MSKVPQTVTDHIENAKLFFDAASKFPSPTNDAVHLLLLLVSWENIVLAQHELSAWANNQSVDKKILRDHKLKFELAPAITEIRIVDGKTYETLYNTPEQLHQLRQECQYGSKSGSRNINKRFEHGWHIDTFRQRLHQKIDWEETSIGWFEGLLSSK